MTWADGVTFTVASVCYSLCLPFTIRIRGGISVPTAAALAPAVVGLGFRLHTPNFLLLMPTALGAIACLFYAERGLAILRHLALFLVTVLLVGSLSSPDLSSGRMVVVGLCATGLYSGLWTALSKPEWSAVATDFRILLLLYGVVLCGGGLTVSVVERMGWPTFVAMAAVLVVTKREFEGFALSRRAYDQTVDALDWLMEHESLEAQ